jgi:hypothetical protein
MIAQWIDTRDRQPTENADYLVQTALGDEATALYTTEGGWNSFIDSEGKLHCGDTDQSLYIVRWFDAPKPPAVPEEWYIEWLRG